MAASGAAATTAAVSTQRDQLDSTSAAIGIDSTATATASATAVAAATPAPYQIRYLTNQYISLGYLNTAVAPCLAAQPAQTLLAANSYGFSAEFTVDQDNTSVTLNVKSLCGLVDSAAGVPTKQSLQLAAWQGPQTATTAFYGFSAANNGVGWSQAMTLNAGRYTLYLLSLTATRESNSTSSNDDYLLGNIQLTADKPINSKAVSWTDGTVPLLASP